MHMYPNFFVLFKDKLEKHTHTHTCVVIDETIIIRDYSWWVEYCVQNSADILENYFLFETWIKKFLCQLSLKLMSNVFWDFSKYWIFYTPPIFHFFPNLRNIYFFYTSFNNKKLTFKHTCESSVISQSS
jgi:hypothetical protein